jgi:DNA-binding transcriptional regulator YdaS (Cro superfamily)
LLPACYIGKMTLQEALDDAIRARGGYAEVARLLGVSRQSVYKWVYRRVPADRLGEVEWVTGIPRERLRPDIFDIRTTRATRQEAPPPSPD